MMKSFPDPSDARKILEVLQADGVIAYPTEAVWGLGCDPFSEIAVERILAMKLRERSKGLILSLIHI